MDVSAKAEIHRHLRALAASGMALLVASSEIPELLALCDRIVVMRQGRVVGERTRAAGDAGGDPLPGHGGDGGARVVIRTPWWQRLAPLLGLFLLCLVLSLASPHFLTVDNLLNVLRQSAINAILALGQLVVIITAGIDLSIGSVVGLTIVILTLLMRHGVPALLAAAARPRAWAR